ncbi:hypothetical protein M409DRAFT_29612 [Zasmidium cellare ATCC 36951]|uniref:Uncharacterized protein n=1 Tax=Zasmidium cellare ATCC 36951 TaxID=1080233 RepID=A0A6A6C2P1_ZASCE|nr:uncharacterized protein M409DRAFT_29612 [Zasmidium cellare ATCC 36951]KAF2159999.1 hypothetical protein M409DRAFT_29612 [Zasmidium cellare ATCC 36951]
MSIPEAATLSAEQQARLHEVADLMLTIYTTLAEMRYVRPVGIIKGPHDITDMRETYTKHKLSPEIIYLYSILPYIDTDLADAGDFFQGGEFYNHMDPRQVERGRDPCYSSPREGFDVEQGEYMHPWYTPLSNCGNHSSIIVYDARGHRIWILDQIQRNSTDPFFCPLWYGEVVKAESNWGDNEGSEGSSEFWDDEDQLDQTELDGLKADRAEEIEYDEGFDIVEQMSEWDRPQALNLTNQNSLELIFSRDATDALRDINQYYRDLKEIPGQGEHTRGIWQTPKLVRPLYPKNGWPDDFNGDGFEIDMIRADAAKRARHFSKMPLQQVRRCERWAPSPETEKHKHQAENASDLDAKWGARFKLFEEEGHKMWNDRQLQRAREKVAKYGRDGKAQREEDLPLWEYEQMRVDMSGSAERTQRPENWKDAYGDDEKSIRILEIKHQHHIDRLTLHERALASPKADAERLCPGWTFQEATGMKSLGPPEMSTKIERTKDVLAYSQKYFDMIREFAESVPKEATEATKAVSAHMKRWERDVFNRQESLKKYEERLKAHGNIN